MRNKFNIILSTTALAGAISLGSMAYADNVATSNSEDQNGQYGLIDYKMQIVPETETSQGNPPAVDTTTANGDGTQYGVADVKSGTAMTDSTSMGENQIPDENQLTTNSGIGENKAQAGTKEAVVSSDGAAVGTVEKVVSMGDTDEVYVRVDDTVDTPVSLFKISVPASDMSGDKLTLNMKLSDILNTLEMQQDAAVSK